MAEIHTTNVTNSSPPPNCAICLGTCTNKCFSDSCMHQFCFKCLLEWSRVKAVCPLCKQPFTSIIHNVKSNNEYDEHFIEPSDVLPVHDGIDDDFLLLPTAPPSRHFQFRTTFTVDPRGELAIQQMLLTHPLTNSVYMPDYSDYTNHRYNRHRRRDSSMSFRRNIYNQRLWVTAPPDITGRYRDITPSFYRENPAARNRLVPWLNRELNALLEENTQQVMHLVDVILGHLNRHHIRSRFFKNLLTEYIGSRTEHFIHEFYNFMRSPYDMIGYDRHTLYSPRPPFTFTISEEESDSDVTVIGTSNVSNTNLFHRPTIEVIEIVSDSSRDSDVIIHEPPPPVVVDLLNSDSDETVINLTTHSNEENQMYLDLEAKSKPNKTSKREGSKSKLKERFGKRKKHQAKQVLHLFTSSDTESSNSSDSNYDKITYKFLRKKRKQKLKNSAKCKYSYIYSDSSDDEKQFIKREKKLESFSKKRSKSKRAHKERSQTPNNFCGGGGDASTSNYKCSDFAMRDYNVKYVAPTINVPLDNFHFQSSESISKADAPKSDNSMPIDYSLSRSNYNSYAETNVSCKVDNEYFPGPSHGQLNYNMKIKNEACHMWYARPPAHDSDSDIE